MHYSCFKKHSQEQESLLKLGALAFVQEFCVTLQSHIQVEGSKVGSAFVQLSSLTLHSQAHLSELK
jgi:hypothetical protein